MKKAALLIIAALVLIPGCWPRRRVIAPEWRLTVLREGRPVANALVTESWKDYSVAAGGQVRQYTDAAGRIAFPERVVYSSPIYRTLGCAMQVVMTGAHASCGPSASTAAYWQNYEGWADYRPGGVLPRAIDLHER